MYRKKKVKKKKSQTLPIIPPAPIVVPDFGKFCLKITTWALFNRNYYR